MGPQPAGKGKKRYIVPVALALAAVTGVGITAAGATGLVDAADDETRAAIRQAVENRDLQAWKDAMHTEIDSTTQEEFDERADKRAERESMHQEKMLKNFDKVENRLSEQGVSDEDIATLKQHVEAGDFEAARDLKKELGLQRPEGDKGRRGFHKGGHHKGGFGPF